jgi:hypothetical protein
MNCSSQFVIAVPLGQEDQPWPVLRLRNFRGEDFAEKCGIGANTLIQQRLCFITLKIAAFSASNGTSSARIA